MTAINRAMQLEHWCRYNEGVWLDADMRTESRFDVLLSKLSLLEEAGLNPDTALEDQSEANTVVSLSGWYEVASEGSQEMALDALWTHIDEIVSVIGYTVTTHPDDPACLGLWHYELFGDA